MSAPGSGPPDHPGFVVVAMTGVAANDATTLEAQADLGYSFVAFYSVGNVTNALLSRGYNGHNDR